MNYDIAAFTFLSVVLLVILGLVALALYKVRKIHLATYVLKKDAAAARRESEALFDQIQALLALERKLGLAEALPPMRGWAGSPDFLLAITDEILARRPDCVMECSSGVSTIVVARCLQMNGAGHAYCLEHGPEYAAKTRALLKRYGLGDWATVLDAPLQNGDSETPWYAEEAIPGNIPPIDMLIIDGPPGGTAPFARFPALPRLMPRMADHHIVILDDADREDEVKIIRRWMALYPQLKKQRRKSEKGLVFLIS